MGFRVGQGVETTEDHSIALNHSLGSGFLNFEDLSRQYMVCNYYNSAQTISCYCITEFVCFCYPELREQSSLLSRRVPRNSLTYLLTYLCFGYVSLCLNMVHEKGQNM